MVSAAVSHARGLGFESRSARYLFLFFLFKNFKETNNISTVNNTTVSEMIFLQYFGKNSTNRFPSPTIQTWYYTSSAVPNLQPVLRTTISAFSSIFMVCLRICQRTPPPTSFLTLVQYCFSSAAVQECQNEYCYKISFIKCGFCEKCLCFEHFYTAYHYHELV